MNAAFTYETTTDPSGSVCVVALVGELDPDGARQLGPALTGLFDAGRRRFVLDFSRLEYIGSLGLRAVLTLHNKLRTAEGVVVLADVPPRVQQVLDVTRLNDILQGYPTVGEAIDAIRSA